MKEMRTVFMGHAIISELQNSTWIRWLKKHLFLPCVFVKVDDIEQTVTLKKETMREVFILRIRTKSVWKFTNDGQFWNEILEIDATQSLLMLIWARQLLQHWNRSLFF